MISDEHYDILKEKISKSAIISKALRDDLIDHYCCLVEMHMQNGASFKEAYDRAYQQTTPNGFEEIERETIFLLNHKKIIIMKQLTYISGYLFALSTTAGAFFKIMHFPGANVLLLAGMLGIAFIFLPLLLVNKFKNKVFSMLSEKLKWVFGTVSIMTIIMAVLFKTLHWQGAAMLLALGFVLFGLGYLPFLFFRMYQSTKTDVSH